MQLDGVGKQNVVGRCWVMQNVVERDGARQNVVDGVRYSGM